MLQALLVTFLWSTSWVLIKIGFADIPPLTFAGLRYTLAFAFTLWNLTLQTLPAVESSIINSTMTIQIPILAVLFLGESLNAKEITGLVLAAAGVLLVQLGRSRQP